MSEFEDKLQSILGDADAMGRILSLAQSISGAPGAEEAPADGSPAGASSGGAPPEGPLPLLEGLDPRLLQLGAKLLAEYRSGDDRKAALLTALQPFVREERCAKLDKAIRIAKLSRVIRVALDTLRKGEEEYV